MGILRKTILIVILVGLIGSLLYLFMFRNNEIVINIENKTKKEISGLSLEYKYYEKKKDIGTIGAGEKKTIKADLPDNFDEGAIILSYKDKTGENHEEILFAYLEKGYSGKSDVILSSIDDEGKISIETSEN
ncbi:hypothetical protein [Bacillus infantis]|uniref:hypothetical protein n=1 Tax=Bacillus infantis TaxID=324767 RepID=UPI003CF8D9F7